MVGRTLGYVANNIGVLLISIIFVAVETPERTGKSLALKSATTLVDCSTMASISRQPKEMQDRHRRILANMLKQPDNRECADCRARNPTWASTNLGVFLCIRCSGLHRQVGVHITKVKSCTMDLWDPDQVVYIQKIGNGKARRIYEAKLPPNYGKPAESEDSALVLQWIRAKYEKRKFIHDNPMAIIDEATGSPTNAAAAGGARTTASGAADANDRPIGRGRRDRQPPQQQPPPSSVSGSAGGDSWASPASSAFDFVNQGAAGNNHGSNGNIGSGFPTTTAWSADGSASPAFGVMPGSAFGFIASPAAATPPGSAADVFGSASLNGNDKGFSGAGGFGFGAPAAISGNNNNTAAWPPGTSATFPSTVVVDTTANKPPAEDPLDFSYAASNSTSRPPAQPNSRPDNFDPFAEAATPAAVAAVNADFGISSSSNSSNNNKQSHDGGDFVAQMRLMQQQLDAQRAYLDALQREQAAASSCS